MLGLFDTLGAPEILIILAVVLLLFGAKKLPELARSLGKSSTEFKKGLKEGGHDALPDGSEQAPATTPAPAPAAAATPAPTAAESKPAETTTVDE